MVYHLKCLSCHSVSKVEILRMGIAAAKKIKDKFLSSSSLFGVIPNIRFFHWHFVVKNNIVGPKAQSKNLSHFLN